MYRECTRTNLCRTTAVLGATKDCGAVGGRRIALVQGLAATHKVSVRSGHSPQAEDTVRAAKRKLGTYLGTVGDQTNVPLYLW